LAIKYSHFFISVGSIVITLDHWPAIAMGKKLPIAFIDNDSYLVFKTKSGKKLIFHRYMNLTGGVYDKR